jgi:hypothetical protein
MNFKGKERSFREPPPHIATHLMLTSSRSSGFYDEVVNDDGETEGESTLIYLGYQLGGEA